MENGLKLPPAEINFDLTIDGGKSLRIGNVLLSEKTFTYVLKTPKELFPRLGPVLGDEGGKLALLFRWPEALFQHGLLEMVSRSGRMLWTYEITPDAVAAWKKQLESWRKEMKGRGIPEKDLQSGIFATQFGLLDAIDKGGPFLKQPEFFRFCLTQVQGQAQTRLCSQRYGMRYPKGQTAMVRVPVQVPNKVIFMGEQVEEMKGTLPITNDEIPAQFGADLMNGESYEFLALPQKPSFADISDTARPGLWRLAGFGPRPLEPHILANKDAVGKFTAFLGFEPTIGDQRKFWVAGVTEGAPYLHFAGDGAGVFRQRLQMEQIPPSAVRIHIDKDTPRGTYIDGFAIQGRKQADTKVFTDQNKVRLDGKDPSQFTWEFKARNRGEMNRSVLHLTSDDKTYHSFHEMYLGYANELSGRMTGIWTGGGFLFWGDISYNRWFESLLGWSNRLLSRQRWGLSARYFKSLNQIPVGSGVSASLDVMTFDLKYRATPGIWTRDESVGAMLAYQNVTYATIKAPMLGVGAFWARSMPRVFDDFFNLFPFMEYPKWVDMELIYFVKSMNADVKLNNTLALNFHGQVLWKKNYFGEAGFGFKRYGFTDTGQNMAGNLNTFYGTVGLGFKF